MKIYWRAVGPGGLYLIGAALLPALMPLMASAQAQTAVAPPSAATSVAQVEIARNGQQTTVRVASGDGSGPLSYHVLRLSDPARVVVDFDHAHLSVNRNAIPSGYQPVHGVRLSQFHPDQVRLVIDLDHRAAYSLENGERTMAVNFADTAELPVAAVRPSPDKPSSDAQPVAKRQAAATRVQPVVAPEFPLPAALTGSAASLARPVPQTVSAPVKSEPVLSAAVQAQAAAPAQQAAPQGPSVYSGEPISVNLKDVDLKDFFRLIHEISGLNVVLDPSVQGRVTLVLDEVPWDQALEIVMRNNGLAKEINGNVLRIASQDTLRKEAETKRDLAKAESEAVDPVTSTRVLSYAKASDITNTLKHFLSSRGDIIADDRSNSLIIRDIPASMPQIDDLIRQLDRKSQQVGIEARVVSASRSFARDIGTQFGFSTTFGNNAVGGATAAGASPLSVTSLAPPLVTAAGGSSLPLLSNFPANAPTSGFSFANRSPNFALDYIITAAESKGVGKLLSSPQLVTQNNAKATVKQGTKVPIQTSINNTVSVQYIDAVLQLQVTPQITADGTIFMDVLVENTQIDPGIARVQGIPALDTQAAETKVLINDGGTVVIGGVMTSSQTTTVQQVPVVGSVPLIGHLFKRTAVSVSSQELLFFLTPRIMPG